MKRVPLLAALCLCLPALSLDLFPTNIFNNDALMRTVATGEELRWTVSLGGCSGSMLSPKYLLTANHCSPRVGSRYTSGACLEMGCRQDLEVVRVVERNATFDSAIVEVVWSRSDTRWRQRYTPRVQRTDSELEFGRDAAATELFTVGFPTDKSKAMHARGYAKKAAGNFLSYNVPSINGNSGGAVWKKLDNTLVSQTNFGPQAFGEQGWRDRDPEDSTAWNGGPRMNRLYDASPALREVFPEGENRNVSGEGILIWDDALQP